MRFFTAGESHGPGLITLIDGVPAALALAPSDIDPDLHRRQLGYGRGARQRIERDAVIITAGVRQGRTTGAPLALQIPNRDAVNWERVMSVTPVPDPPPAVTRLRPGHADLAGALKYDHGDVRDVIERSSARETAARVAAGAVAKAILRRVGMEVRSETRAIGSIEGVPTFDADAVEASEVRCSDANRSAEMVAAIAAAREAGDTLGGVAALRVTGVVPGLGTSEIAAAVEKAFPKITKDQFLAAAVVGTRKNAVLAGLDAKTPLEGFLFPDTYFFRPDASAAEIVDTLLTLFEQRAGGELANAAKARNMTVYDLVKLASIVEREARDRKESATIAGVYQNRLDIGMKLDADPTIQYALGDWRELTLDDLKLDSPYNTYLNAGLPPTPIASPGQSALDGAAHPEKHDYLYFVAKNDGTGDHAFAKTLDEQEANRVKYGNK